MLLALLVLIQAGPAGAVVVRGAHYPVWTVILGYLAAGTAAGLLVGVCRPVFHAVPFLGGLLLGPAIGIVVYATVSLAMSGWRTVNWGAALLAGSLVGLGVGAGLGWRQADERDTDW